MLGLEEVKASAISTAQLKLLRALHLRPIKQVVYLWPYPRQVGVTELFLG